MDGITVTAAKMEDIPFIKAVYEQNMAQLHGAYRSLQAWEELLKCGESAYYIVRAEEPVAWFRTETEEGTLWLGMLQVMPDYQRKGIGLQILSYFQALAAEKEIRSLGIHTTEDNLAARRLYEKAGYALCEIGPCTTADGVDRVGYTYMKTI